MPARQHVLHRRFDRLLRAESRLARTEDDVRHQHEVAVLREDRRVVVVILARRDVAVQALRQQLVRVDDHRILLRRIVVRRIVEQRLERHADRALEVEHLDLAPRVVLRVGIRLDDRLRVRDVGADVQHWAAVVALAREREHRRAVGARETRVARRRRARGASTLPSGSSRA